MTQDEEKIPKQLDRNSSTPLYVQLRNILCHKIISGEWAPDSVIPSENELCQMYNISRMTARSVITQLVNDGLLYRIPGKGTYVKESKLEITNLTYVGLRSQLESQGRKVVTKLVSIAQAGADEYIARKLNIAAGSEVYVIERLRYVDDSPVSLHVSYVPCRLCPGLDKNPKRLEEEQLCNILSMDYSLFRAHVTETLESYIANTKNAEILKVVPGFPLLLLQDVITTREGTVFEYTCVYFRGDKIKLRLEYK